MALLPQKCEKNSSAVCEKLVSNDDFDIVVRPIENLEVHVLKISVSIRLNHCSYFVIEPLHGGIGHVPETPDSRNSVPMLQYGLSNPSWKTSTFFKDCIFEIKYYVILACLFFGWKFYGIFF